MGEGGKEGRSLQVDTLAAELVGLAVLHREEWTPGCAIDVTGRVPAAARVCSVASELSVAASHVIGLRGELERVDHVPGEPNGDAWLRTSLSFARVAAAAVCAYSELDAATIAEDPNRLRRRMRLVGEIDETCWAIAENHHEMPGGPVPGGEATVDNWLPAAVERLAQRNGRSGSPRGPRPSGRPRRSCDRPARRRGSPGRLRRHLPGAL